VAPLLRQAPAHASGKARVSRCPASTGRSRGLAIIRIRSVDAPCCAASIALQVGDKIVRFVPERHRRQAEDRPGDRKHQGIAAAHRKDLAQRTSRHRHESARSRWKASRGPTSKSQPRCSTRTLPSAMTRDADVAPTAIAPEMGATARRGHRNLLEVMALRPLCR
jgi:hypothetical protein